MWWEWKVPWQTPSCMVKSRGEILRGRPARQWLDDAKERTRLSSTDMWFEPENGVAWRKRVSRDAPNRLYSSWESTFKIQDQQDRLNTSCNYRIQITMHVFRFSFHDLAFITIYPRAWLTDWAALRWTSMWWRKCRRLMVGSRSMMRW